MHGHLLRVKLTPPPHGAKAKTSSLSRNDDHIQLNTVHFSPKVMGQSIVFLCVLENPY